MKIKPHDRLRTECLLTPEMVSEQALAVGDTNPVHHDALDAPVIYLLCVKLHAEK